MENRFLNIFSSRECELKAASGGGWRQPTSRTAKLIALIRSWTALQQFSGEFHERDDDEQPVIAVNFQSIIRAGFSSLSALHVNRVNYDGQLPIIESSTASWCCKSTSHRTSPAFFTANSLMTTTSGKKCGSGFFLRFDSFLWRLKLRGGG